MKLLTQGKRYSKKLLLGASLIASLFTAATFAEPSQRFIIKYKDPLQSTATTESRTNQMMQNLATRSGLPITHVRKMAMSDRHVLKLSKKHTRRQFLAMLKELEKDSNVVYVEEDVLMQPNLVPNDTFYNLQWHYFEATGGINAELAWDTHDGTGVVVAIIDTGITDHTDLNANVLPGYDFIDDLAVANDGDGRDADPSDPGDWVDDFECGFNFAQGSSWHGTHTAGTVAALTNNGQGVSGVAFGARILPVRVLGKCGGFLSDISDAIIWASGGSVTGVPDNTNPAQVINMSLGGGGDCDSTYQDAIDIAVANGTTVVVSAGNSSADAINFRPANCNGVITVAANDREGNLASYSNFGAIIDVTAPGGETDIAQNGVASTLNDGAEGPGAESYVYYQGTSMSAPHVAGAAALLYQANPAITPSEVEAVLIASARAMPGDCVGGCGAGIIDAKAALDSLGPPANIAPSAEFNSSVSALEVTFTDTSSDPDGSVISWSWDFGDGNNSSVQNPVYSYAVDGTYSVILTVTDNEGATDAVSQDITINATNNLPSANFSYATDNLQAAFTDASSDSDGSITSWSWDFGDSSTSTTQNPVYSYSADGTYNVSLTVTDNNGATDTSVQAVTVADTGSETTGGFTETGLSPAAGSNLSYTIEVPAGATLLEVSTSGGTGNVDLAINFDSAPNASNNECLERAAGNEHTCSVSNPSAGTWYIIVRGAATSSGVQLDAYWHAEAVENQAPSAIFTASTNLLEVTFTDASSDSDGTIASRSWDFGDGNSSNLQNPVYTYAAAGTYSVTLTVTDNEGATDSSTQSLIVSEAGGSSDGFTELVSPASGEIINFTIDVPAGADSLDISLSGGTGNVDLAINFASAPTRNNNVCIELGDGNEHSCSIASPQEGTWFIVVRGVSASTDVQLDAYWFDN